MTSGKNIYLYRLTSFRDKKTGNGRQRAEYPQREFFGIMFRPYRNQKAGSH